MCQAVMNYVPAGGIMLADSALRLSTSFGKLYMELYMVPLADVILPAGTGAASVLNG